MRVSPRLHTLFMTLWIFNMHHADGRIETFGPWVEHTSCELYRRVYLRAAMPTVLRIDACQSTTSNRRPNMQEERG